MKGVHKLILIMIVFVTVFLLAIISLVPIHNQGKAIELKDLLSIAIGVGGTIFGIITYIQNRVLKRQEIILPLMREFEESPRLKTAKDILEDKPLYPNSRMGWNIDIDDYYTRIHLKDILRPRDERPVQDKGENEIRESFDALLDFFGKLGYLLDIEVISRKEIRFFLYFIKKTKDEEAVIDYVKKYEFQMFPVLLYKLGALPESLLGLKDSYYRDIDQTKSSFERLSSNIQQSFF